MTEQNLAIDESGDPKYYIMTPQIVHALCDSPYEYTLWDTIKCIAGEAGECFLATDDLATMAMMSAGKCSQCRKSLIDKGLLIGNIRKDPGYPQPVWHLTIPNLWAANRKWREDNPSLLDRIELKREQKKSLHHVKPSPDEEPPSPDEEPPSPDETKKNQQEEPTRRTRGKKPPPNRQSKSKRPPTIPSFQIFVDITGIYGVNKHWRDKMGSTVGDEPESLEKWKNIIITWTGKGFKPINVEGQLEWFTNGIPPEYSKKGAANNGQTNPTTLSPSQAEVYAKIERERLAEEARIASGN